MSTSTLYSAMNTSATKSVKTAATSSSPSPPSPSPSSSTSSRGAALIVVVHHGRRVLGQNRFSSRRPYIVLRTDSTERCTRVTEHKGGLQPVWEEQLYLPIALHESVVRIACFNKDQRPRRASVSGNGRDRNDEGGDVMIGLGHWRVDKARETPTGRWHGWVLLKNPVTGEGTGEIYISVMYLVSARAGSAGSSGGVAAPEEAKVPAAASTAPPAPAFHTVSTVSVLASSISASSVSSSAQSSDTSGDHLDSDSDSPKSTHPDEAGREAAGDVEKADEGEPQVGEENVRRRNLRRVSSSLSTPPCCYRPPRSPTMLKRMKSVASLPAMHLFSGSGETKLTTTTTTTMTTRTVVGTQTVAVTEPSAVLFTRTRRSTHHSQEDMRASSILAPADRVNDGSNIGIPEEPEDEHNCTHHEPRLLPPQSNLPTPSSSSIITPSDHHEDEDSSEAIQELPVLLWLTRPITHEHLVKMAFIDRVCASSTKAQIQISRRRTLRGLSPSPAPCWAGASPRTVRWRLSQVFAGGSVAGADKDATIGDDDDDRR